MDKKLLYFLILVVFASMSFIAISAQNNDLRKIKKKPVKFKQGSVVIHCGSGVQATGNDDKEKSESGALLMDEWAGKCEKMSKKIFATTGCEGQFTGSFGGVSPSTNWYYNTRTIFTSSDCASTESRVCPKGWNKVWDNSQLGKRFSNNVICKK